MGIRKEYAVFTIEVFDTENPCNYGNPLVPKNTVQKCICYGEEWLERKVKELSKEFENYDCKITNDTLDKVLYQGNIANYKKEEYENESYRKITAA